MPIEYRVDEERGVVRSRAHGVVTPQELLAHIRKLIADERVPAPIHEIWDGSELEKFDAWASDVRGFLETATAALDRFGGAALAIVAPGSLLFGLGRMAQLLADSSSFRISVHRTLDEALAWMRERVAERDAPRDSDPAP